MTEGVWRQEYEVAGHIMSAVRKHENDKDIGFGCQTSRAVPSDRLPKRLRLLKIPQPSQTALPTGDQVAKHMSLCGTFQTQTTAKADPATVIGVTGLLVLLQPPQVVSSSQVELVVRVMWELC